MWTRIIEWLFLLTFCILGVLTVGLNGCRLPATHKYLAIVPGDYCIYERGEAPVSSEEMECSPYLSFSEAEGAKVSYIHTRTINLSLGLKEVGPPVRSIRYTHESTLVICGFSGFIALISLFYLRFVRYVHGFKSWGCLFLFIWNGYLYYRNIVWKKGKPITEITDAQMKSLSSVLIPLRIQRNEKTRRMLSAILWAMQSGAEWRNIPADFPEPEECQNLFYVLARSGQFPTVIQRLSQ